MKNSRLSALILFTALLSAVPAFCQWKNIPIAEAASPIHFDTDANDVYVLTTGGVYKSPDRGDHWQLIPGSPVLSADAVHMQAEKGVIYVLSGGEIHRTEDAGAHWTRVLYKPYPSNAPGEKLSRMYVTGDTVLVGTNLTIYRSTDRGNSWAVTADWFCFGGYRDFAKIGSDIFAVVDWYILKSEDGGLTWTEKFSASFELGAMAAVNDVLYAKYGGYARIIRSFDHGNHWNVIDADSLGYFFNTTFNWEDGLAGLGNRLFYYKRSYQGAIARSLDQGAHWENPTIFEDGFMINDLLVLPDRLLAATSHGVLVSFDEGLTFSPAMNGMFASTVIKVEKTCGARWWAAAGGGIYYSDNEGQNWALDSAAQNIPLHSTERIFDQTDCTFLYSENNGQNWSNISLNAEPDCYKVTTSEQAALFYTDERIFRLKDHESSVQEIVPPPLADRKIWGLKEKSGLLICELALSSQITEIYVSDVNSISWHRIPDYLGLFLPGAYLNWDKDYLFPSDSYVSHSILRVSDTTWVEYFPVNALTGDSIPFRNISFIHTAAGKRWFGVAHLGLFYSELNDPFHLFPYDPPVPYPNLLCAYVDDQNIWVGTRGTNIYALDLPLQIPMVQAKTEAFALFPNPSPGVARLRSNEFFTRPLDLRIFDAAGKMVHREVLPPGNNWSPELGFLSPGLYFWEIRDEKGVSVLKWVKER